MRTGRRFIVFGVLSVLFLFGALSGPPERAVATGGEAVVGHEHSGSAQVAPHEHAEGEPGDPDLAEHMAQDLVGTPMDQIEKQTGVNAARIQRETGLRPGNTRSKAKVAADPAVSGAWSAVADTPVVPVFEAVLPNGKVLIWDSVGDNAAESYPDHTFTRAMVWNPVDNTNKRVDLQGNNIFCAGFAHMSNGNILVAGGNLNASLAGTVTTYIFNWQSETWSRGKDMAAGRWYPAVAETANGEQVIIGGGPATAEVYQNDGALRSLTGFTKYNARLYPFLGSRPDTGLAMYGPYPTAYTVTTSGNGQITATTTRDNISRDYGSFATYDVGKTLVLGGGILTEGGVAKVPTKTSVVMSSGTGLTPSTVASGSMSVGRRQQSATLLADGSVLATGGMTSAATGGFVDLAHAATAAERWDPATGQWTVLASASRIRQYHSTAVLLPDGRVMTGGGGVCGVCVTAGYLEKNVEYFTPPYLYKKDGSGDLATRPVISAAPATVGINTGFTVTSPDAANVGKVALVGLGDATHSVDQGQRYVPLNFSVSGTTLTVTGPPTGGVAPPGYYMLFIVGTDGVPSVAKMVQVAKGPNPLMSPLTNSTGRCVDVPSSSLTPKTYLQTYNCNKSKAQALTRLTSDGTLRVLGSCLDVPSSNFALGQKIWIFSCNGSAAQKWQFGTDGTIRPVGNTTICLAATSADNQAGVFLAKCNGVPVTKWTW